MGDAVCVSVKAVRGVAGAVAASSRSAPSPSLNRARIVTNSALFSRNRPGRRTHSD